MSALALVDAPASTAVTFTGKATTIALLIAPPAALITAAAIALHPTWRDVALGVLLYVIAMGGVTIGYHRLLTHRSFKAAPWLRAVLTMAGASSMEGVPIGWVAMHRRHHQNSDNPGDPHSPHTHGPGSLGVLRGFWHAHAGWLLAGETTQETRYAPDLVAEPLMRGVDRIWWVFPLLGIIVIPAAVGAAFGGWRGLLSGLLWAGVLRAGLVHHVSWSVNSVCHLWGKRPFESRDESRNVGWLAPFSLGESWHNTHHAFPTSARHGVDPGQWDASARFIALAERFGWASDVKWLDRATLEKRRRTNA